MSSYLEFEGKDIDNVTEKVSKKLNIPLDKLNYDVISYGSTGIFGLVGTKKARIRVTLPETDIEPVSNKAAEENLQPADAAADETIQEALNMGQTALQKIVDQITTGANITVEVNSERIQYDVKGDNAAILIGKRGQTLEAIQYLIEKIVNRQHPNRLRVRVDIEGYLENKRNNLIQMAERMAKKAKQTGKPASVGQMNAHDRRIVHLALKNNHDVRTQSMGEGFYRKLVIFPRENASRKQKPQ